MKKLETLNDDLFKPFENDQVCDLQAIKGGTKEATGHSGGNIYQFPNLELFCWGDTHFSDGSYELYHCSSV